MNGTECSIPLTVTIKAEPHGAEPHGGMAELVRGQEGSLLECVEPLVRGQSVALDMRHVERIDAAGIAALITLYCAARQAGHAFTISHAAPRVEEILALVGVKHLLASEDAETAPECNLPLVLTAA